MQHETMPVSGRKGSQISSFAQHVETLARLALPVAGAVIAMLLVGYHPSAEDGGIYAAAVQARLNPALFPRDQAWVTAHTRFALFVPLTAALTHFFHLPLTAVLFALQVAGLVALMAAAAHLARSILSAEALPWLAMLAVAVGAGFPVAGTALYGVDPYCTARTITTPLLLFAFSLALRRRWSLCALCWIAAGTLHPLMAIWGAIPLLLTWAFAARNPWRWALALTFALLLAALGVGLLSPAETATTRQIASTRGYWFPARWQWFEWAGAVAPCLLLLILGRWMRAKAGAGGLQVQRIATVCTTTTLLAVTLAILFARESATSLEFARLQPLRSLHLVFLAFLTCAGACLQQRLTSVRAKAVGLAACGVMASSSFLMQRSLYPDTPHLELPGRAPGNLWEEAFRWCRSNTPENALFALDARYIDQPGEDSHGFRAVALRSALPDGVKDAGIAAVLPALSPAWRAGVAATQDLDHLADDGRRERLNPLGVTWVVLPSSAETALPCPFHNGAVQVCRLR